MQKSIDHFQKEIEKFIQEINLEKQPKGLYEPVSYCLNNGGKRVRPLMTLLACDLFEGNIMDALPPAVGLELFHNFTLLHDDIMDEADIRRNRPTIHKKWNINTAILSGDLMYALAYSYVSQAPDYSLRKVIDLFNKTVVEVCEGQQLDMDFEQRQVVSATEYLEMIRLKTAVLPAACLQTGAIIAGASDNDQANIYKFGEQIGLAFQLRDDWLDVYADANLFGKKTGGDIIANKKTWLYIHAIEMARDDQKAVLLSAFNNEIKNNDEKVRIVKNIYDHLDINAIAQKAMKEHYIMAFDYLESVNVKPKRKALLEQLAEILLNRQR